MKSHSICSMPSLFQWAWTSQVKNRPANAGDIRDAGSIPGLGRSPGGQHSNPLQYSWLKNPWTEKPGRLQSMGSRLKWLNTMSVLQVHPYCRKCQSYRFIHIVENDRISVLRLNNILFLTSSLALSSAPPSSAPSPLQLTFIGLGLWPRYCYRA